MSTPDPFNFPVIITSSGLQPQSPSSLQQQLLAAVATTNPGYTANLPGIMIEDMSSTQVASMAIIDQAKVDTVNSLTPNAANEALLVQLGQVYGLTLGTVTNTSVLVVFTGTVGYVVSNGFLVSDGTNTYQVQNGGVVQSGGSTASLTAIAINSGSFAVPANTVTTLLTSVPAGITLSVNNPTAGTPGSTGETWQSFRARVLQAGLASSVGTARYLKTLLLNVPGVTTNLVSVQQASGGGIRVVASGGDTYAIAYAIFSAIADPSELVGSAVSSGRNVTVSLNDYPDTYSILYVATQTQTVTMTVTWNTTLSSFTGGGAFPSLVQQPLANYINALAPGQPINELEMNAIFQDAVAGSLDPTLLTRLVFSVYINGTLTPVGSGTYIVSGDAESVFSTTASAITVTQG